MATVRGVFDLNARPASSALRGLRRDTRDLRRELELTGQRLDRIGSVRQQTQVRAYSRQVAGLRREMAETLLVAEALDERLAALGSRDVRPNIDVDVAGALAQVELLHSRINALGRASAAPRIGLGGFGGGGGGRVPTGRGGGGFGGGGNDSSFGLRSINIGPLNLGRSGFPIIAGVGLPAIRGLAGGATSLVGTLGLGAVGAGAVGVAGGGAFAGALTNILGVAIPAAGAISEAAEALEDYQEAVREHGRASREAREGLRLLNATLAGAPGGTGRLLRSRDRLSDRWNRLTAPAQADLVGVLQSGIDTAGGLAPLAARQANMFWARSGVQAGRFGSFLTGAEGRAGIRGLGTVATENLDEVEGILENITATFFNLTRAARPFLAEFMQWTEELTGRWRRGTGDIRSTRREIGEMLDHFRSFARLTGASIDLLGALLGAAAPEGQTMVDHLTDQFREWERWIERNPRQVRAFFRETREDVESMAASLSSIVDFLEAMGDVLRPLLPMVETLAGALASVGPGAIPLMIAGRRAMRGRVPGGPGAGGPGGPAVPPILPWGRGGGPGRVPGARGYGSTYGLARSFGYGRAAAAGAAVGAGILGATGRVGGALGAFGRAYLPLGAGLAAFQALGFQGSLLERGQAGLSAFTLGAIPMPMTDAQQADFANQQAAEEFEAIRRAVMGADRPGLRVLGARSRGGIALNQPGRLGLQMARIETLRSIARPGGVPLTTSDAINADPAAQAELARSVMGLARDRSRALATSQLGDIARGFDIRTGAGAKPGAAMEDATEAILDRVRRLRGDTRREFANMSLEWLREMRRTNPKLRAEVRDASEAIENRLRRMGQNVRVIHGRIRDVSAEAWEGIRGKLASESERARQEVSENFTALQRQALEVLVSMGFSRKDARNLINTLEKGDRFDRAAARQGIRGGPGSYAAGIAAGTHAGPAIPPGTNRRIRGARNATGGRLAGSHMLGTQDHIMMPDGSLAAGDELIVNRHTEQRVNRYLSLIGTSLEREVSSETRPHSGPVYRRPGASGFREENAAYGKRGGGARGGLSAAAALAQRLGLHVGEGPGFGGIPTSGHAQGSYHYRGLAYDVSGAPAAMARYFRLAERRFGSSLAELFYDPIGYYIKNGQRVPGAIGGHGDHVHIALMAGAAGRAGGPIMGGGGAAAMRMDPLRAPGTRLAGIPGALSARAGDVHAQALTQAINRRLRAGAGGPAGAGAGRGGLNSWLTRALRITGHYSPENLRLLRGRALQESGGDPRAINEWDINAQRGDPSRGLLQTIGATFNAYKLPRMGNIWNPVHNAVAAIRYMMDRYGHIVGPGPGGYAYGGRIRNAGAFRRGGTFTTNGPTSFLAGDGVDEEVTVRPLRERIRRPRRGGGGVPATINVNLGGVTVNGDADVERLGKRLGEKVAAAIAEGLDNADAVPDEELM